MDKKKTVNIDMKQYGMVLALIAVFLIFAVMTGGKNMSPANINNLIMQNGYVVILAVGMLLCCLTGNIDLGVGSIVALCGATVGILMIDCHTNMWVAILAALAVGVLAGMFVGLFVSKLSIPLYRDPGNHAYGTRTYIHPVKGPDKGTPSHQLYLHRRRLPANHENSLWKRHPGRGFHYCGRHCHGTGDHGRA